LKSELLLSEFPLTEFPLCGFSLASEGLHGFTPAPLVRLFQYWLEGTIKLLCILNEFVCAIDSLQTGDRRGPPMGVAVLQKLNWGMRIFSCYSSCLYFQPLAWRWQCAFHFRILYWDSSATRRDIKDSNAGLAHPTSFVIHH
jgi:hypothetical protein